MKKRNRANRKKKRNRAKQKEKKEIEKKKNTHTHSPPPRPCLLQTQVGWSTTRLNCLFNGSLQECLNLTLSGQCYLPALTIENTSQSGGLFFKPTSTGIVSTRTLRLKNVARVPVVFRWEIPPELKRYVKSVFVIHVGGTRDVTFSTDNIMKIRARI
jgi:hypothetical protein